LKHSPGKSALRQAFEAVKSIQEPNEAATAIRSAFHAASATSPDIEPARTQLGKDVAAADAALNQALAAARHTLLTASVPAG
jgi:hypothetical protein